MTPLPPSNLGATRVHMAKMKRRFAPKNQNPKRRTFGHYCKDCGFALWSFKGMDGLRCINTFCLHHLKTQ